MRFNVRLDEDELTLIPSIAVKDAKLTEIEEGLCKKIFYDKLFLLYPPNTAVYACKGVDVRQMVVYSRSVSDWSTVRYSFEAMNYSPAASSGS